MYGSMPTPTRKKVEIAFFMSMVYNVKDDYSTCEKRI